MVGQARELAERASRDPALLEELVEKLWAEDECERTDAADVLMRLTEFAPELLEAYLPALLELFHSPLPQIMQWHVTLIIPRLRLAPAERRRAFAHLQKLLNEQGSITRTNALEGIARLAIADENLREPGANLLRKALQRGTAAMKARSRRWLCKIERP